MSNPSYGAINAYPSVETARAAWANIVGNERLFIYEVRIGLLNQNVEPVAWVILPEQGRT